MADDAVRELVEPPPDDDFGRLYAFDEVFQQEIDLINLRRKDDPRGTIELEVEDPQSPSGERIRRPCENAGVVGLALSGGGIRSAAFCLGALQALDAAGVLKHVDYMSTVSGGGYIGCSLTASLEQLGSRPQSPRWEFPYRSHSGRMNRPHCSTFGIIQIICSRKATLSFATRRSTPAVSRSTSLLIAPFLLIASAVTLLLYWLRSHTIRIPRCAVLLIRSLCRTSILRWIWRSFWFWSALRGASIARQNSDRTSRKFPVDGSATQWVLWRSSCSSWRSATPNRLCSAHGEKESGKSAFRRAGLRSRMSSWCSLPWQRPLHSWPARSESLSKVRMSPPGRNV